MSELSVERVLKELKGYSKAKTDKKSAFERKYKPVGSSGDELANAFKELRLIQGIG